MRFGPVPPAEAAGAVLAHSLASGGLKLRKGRALSAADAAAIARIHAPVGTDIGAQAPAEIAIAILAQITERLRRPATRP